ncbi:RDD family protein, partial [Streptomyces sp. NPDC126499]|uniref:RDD family protein n=1 Tax=Streptomyces sp. NPDC126499 TaxID=3155314 RepID=UPI003317F961
AARPDRGGLHGGTGRGAARRGHGDGAAVLRPAPGLAPNLAPDPAAQDAAQPVLPWKPVAEDPFLSAARAQAAARPAGLGRRLAARLVDTLVLGAAVGAVSYPFISAALTHINDKIEAAKQSGVTVQVWLVDSTTSVQFGIALAAFLVLGALYEALPTAKWGRTLGKKLCGIEVRDIEAHEPPTFGAALRRWLVYGVLGLLAVGVVNVLWCLFDRPWRQCWHDKAARTFVAR